MPDVTLKFLGDVRELKKKMGEARSESSKTGGGFSKLAGVGKAAMVGLAGGAIAIGAASLEMADKYEVSHARLETALANTGTSFDAVRGSVDKVVKSGAGLGYNATEIEGALATMTTGMGSSKKAIGYLGLAEDVAAQTGHSLAESSIAVTKASEGQLKPLKQLGIDLPVAAGGALKVQKAQEKLLVAEANLQKVQKLAVFTAADKLKKQALLVKAIGGVETAQRSLTKVQSAGDQILGALGRKLDGAASRQADTFGGKIRAVKAQVEDWGIKIGLFLIPWIEKLVSALIGATRWLGDHQSIAKALAITVGVVLVAAITAYIASMIAAAAATLVANAPIIALGVTVAALAAGVWYLWTHWNDVWNWIKGHKAYAAIIAIIFPIIPALIAVVKIVQYLWTHWSQVWSNVQGAVKTAAAVIGTVVSNVIGSVQWCVTMIGNIIGGHWGKAWDQFASAASTAASIVWGFLKGLPGKILSIVPQAASALYNAGGQIIHGMWDGIKSAWNWLADHTTFKLPKFHIPGTSTDIGGGTVSLLPHLAKGGVFDSATLAVIGEASSPGNKEIATPEKLMRQIVREESGSLTRTRQGSGGLTIENMTVIAPDTRAAAAAMSKELAWAAKTTGH